ncbi:MAG: S8 family serine peptidase [Planctomycetota bacterium]|nr:S8 family serine peptidase [Planctomycetota bacterium]
MSLKIGLVLCLLPALAAQEAAWNAALVPGATALGPGPEVHPTRLCLKLSAEVDAEVHEGRLRSRSGADVDPVAQLLQGSVVAPMITGVPRSLLDAWYARAVAVQPPHNRPGHLAHWFVVQCSDATAATRLRIELSGQPTVTHCYHEPMFRGAGSVRRAQGGGNPPPGTPSFTHLQGTLSDPPDGVGLRRAHAILGCRGQDVKLRMVEEDWWLDHEDVSKLHAGNFIGNVPPQLPGISNHGLAGASLLVADRNQFGLTGAVDEADIKFLSFPANNGLANSLVTAAANADEGDVLVMVLMFLLGQLGPDDWVPYEFLQAEFDAVLTATSNGRIVVASAGTGHRSLDDPRLFRRFDRTYRDSGAIFVGATDGVSLVRAAFCNYGSIIDANSWGEDVVSAGYGTLFYGTGPQGNQLVTRSYTERYAGTSASVPIVCGVVVAAQGAARRQLGRNLTGFEIRDLLRAFGTPVPGSIGMRPDTHAILEDIGALDGLELSEPDMQVGSSVLARITGNGLTVLFASLGVGTTHMGFNRPLHLDLGTLVTVELRLVSGSTDMLLAVPNSPALQGINLFFQAGVQATGGPPVHITNSCQLTVL